MVIGNHRHHAIWIVSAGLSGVVQAVAEIYPRALWQRCQVHFHRNVFAVTKSRVREVAAMLKAIHSQENAETAREKGKQVSEWAQRTDAGVRPPASYHP
ncbi:MAG: transposase [Verrucomicrobiae bacterium]|nr:transposase [Verrucomicrobiae bacterium]